HVPAKLSAVAKIVTRTVMSLSFLRSMSSSRELLRHTEDAPEEPLHAIWARCKGLKTGHLEAPYGRNPRIAGALSANPAIAPQAFPDSSLPRLIPHCEPGSICQCNH